MKIAQLHWNSIHGWKEDSNNLSALKPQLLLLFGSRTSLANEAALSELKTLYPGVLLIGCSTAGEICGTAVFDNSLVATALHFEHTGVVSASIDIQDVSDSHKAGEKLIEKFDKKDLRHVFVLSDGLNINGSELVKGMRNMLPENVGLTGGLAGDGSDFKETVVINPLDGIAKSHLLTAVGFYGDRLKVGFGSFGGWDSFGIERLVSKSNNNVLYELDGEPALSLYKSFLGNLAEQLPASALLFPLSLRTNGDTQPVVRTILAVNEQDQSLTFAGDIPQGAYVRLMKANMNRLIDGAVRAANNSLIPDEKKFP